MDEDGLYEVLRREMLCYKTGKGCQVVVPLVLTSLPGVVVHDVGHNRHRSEVACNEEPAWS